jgi:hypothetical protein
MTFAFEHVLNFLRMYVAGRRRAEDGVEAKPSQLKHLYEKRFGRSILTSLNCLF